MSRSDITALYRRYGPLIYSRVRRSARDEREAQEATLDAFEQLLAHAPIGSDEQVVRFLATVARSP